MQRRAEAEAEAPPAAAPSLPAQPAADDTASLEAKLRQQPQNVALMLQLADRRLAERDHRGARELAARAAEGQLDSPRVAIGLLRLLNQLSESGMMVQMAQQLPPGLWDSAKSLAEVAQEMSLIGAHELARLYARAGSARDPNHPPSLYMQATEDVFFGDLGSAANHAEQIIRLLPEDPSAHWLLSRMRLPDAPTRIDRLRSALTRARPGEDEAWLAYALHNELHDIRDYSAAWRALERGCRAKRSSLDYDPAAAQALFDALLQWQPGELDPASTGSEGSEAGASRPPGGDVESSLTPIFVIGLHRSGTTLAERLISGHSKVSPGGETYDIRAQLRRASGIHYKGELDIEIVQRRSQLDYATIGARYLKGMAWRARALPFVTDKLPSNYFNVGFIARALPHARFISLRRDPLDVGLSSLRTLFSNACPYSYDQLEFVQHEQNFQRLMGHWKTLLPDRLLEIDYQSLVDEPEASTARMAEFCGLEFEPEMVQIEKRSDAVATASSVMMREGIRRDRGRLWTAYEQELQPMIGALGARAPIAGA